MTTKLLNLSLILSSLFGYLEWGLDNHVFLFQAEAEIFAKIFSDPLSVAHPFVLLPLFGQLLLLFSLFQQKPSKALTFIGLACIAVLILLMFFIGIISFNFKILASTLPFLGLAVWTVIQRLRKG